VLVAVVDPLLTDQSVLHVEDNDTLPLEVLCVSVGGSLQQRDCMPVVGHHIV